MATRSAFEVVFSITYPTLAPAELDSEDAVAGEAGDADDEDDDVDLDTDALTVTVLSKDKLSIAEFAVRLEETKRKVIADFGYDEDEDLVVEIDSIEVVYQNFAQLPDATRCVKF
jgi:hypothetical protein